MSCELSSSALSRHRIVPCQSESSRARESRETAQPAWVATEESGAQGNKRRPTSAAVVTYIVQGSLAMYVVQQSLITYNDVVTDDVQRSALDLICQCKIYSTVKDRPMHVEESSS